MGDYHRFSEADGKAPPISSSNFPFVCRGSVVYVDDDNEYCDEEQEETEVTSPSSARRKASVTDPVEVAIRECLVVGAPFKHERFEGVTRCQFYLQHELKGTVLMRAAERAFAGGRKLSEFEQLLDKIHSSADGAFLGSYYYHVETQIHVMHYAANQGNIPVMKLLLQKCGSDVLDEYARVLKGSKWEDHYTPLQSAIYMSKTIAAMWLLEEHADPCSQNIDGLSPLHTLAQNGLPYESEMRHDEALVSLATLLVESKADLDMRTKALRDRTDAAADAIRDKTALNLAAVKTSSYPKHMLHLLAKCFAKPEESMPLEEVCIISKVNPSGAEHLMWKVRANWVARTQLLKEVHLSSLEKKALLARFTSAQVVGQDCMQQFVKILRMAPLAAADILDALNIRPNVDQRQKNPLPSYALLRNGNMTVSYQPDVATAVVKVKKPLDTAPVMYPESNDRVQRRDGLVELELPIWKLTSRDGNNWQSAFRTDMPLDPLGHEKVFPVDVRVVHLPDILDFRVIFVLSRMPDFSRYTQVFARIPIVAIVEAFWQRCFNALLFSWFMDISIILCLVWRTLQIQYYQDSPLATQEAIVQSMEVTYASLLVINTVSGVARLPKLLGKTNRVRFKYIRLYLNMFGLNDLFLSCFLLLIWPKMSWFFETGVRKVLIATNSLLLGGKFLMSMRCVPGIGETILAVHTSFYDTRHMLVIMAILAFLFWLVFMAIKDPLKSYGYVFMNLYLALIFGEGDGIENISGFDFGSGTYNPCPYAEGNQCFEWIASVVFMCIASTLYAVVLLNLMIAMYSSYFEKMVPQAQMLIQMRRAKSCVGQLTRPALPDCVIHLLKGRCRFFLGFFAVLMFFVWIICVVLATSFTMLCGSVLTVVFLLIQTALTHDDNRHLPHYLWICYRKDDLTDPVEEDASTEDTGRRRTAWMRKGTTATTDFDQDAASFVRSRFSGS